ncbi:MAG TPA: hypothetical protein VM012_03405 [Flavitalea sp.]|nr:hypothetical protein [Flavitalea sp.]
MKKFSVWILLLCLITKGFAQRDPFETALSKDFLSSIDFQRAFQCIKTPGFDKQRLIVLDSYVKYVEDDRSKPVLYVTIGLPAISADPARLIGEFQVIKAPDNYQKLPNRGRFVMCYRDYIRFNAIANSGIVLYYDLNYDCYLAGTIELENGEIRRWDDLSMPPEIMSKYNFMGYNESIARPHYCDANGNGDVSFGECYSCLKKTCNADPECKRLCDFANKYSRIRNQCAVAMGAACIYISLSY